MRTVIWIAAAIMTAMLAGCGPAGNKTVGKTVSGTRTYSTEWTDIPPARVLIGLGGLDNAAIAWTEERIRDNSIVHQQVWFDGGNLIFVEHLAGPFSLYGTSLTERYNNPVKVVDKYSSAFNVHTADPETGRIRKHGDRGGWVGTGTARAMGGWCIVGSVALLSRADKSRGMDERYDTVVSIRDCSRKRTMEEVERFLTHVRIVSRT